MPPRLRPVGKPADDAHGEQVLPKLRKS